MEMIKINVEYGTFVYKHWIVVIEKYGDYPNAFIQPDERRIFIQADKKMAIKNAKAIREEFPNTPIHIYDMKGKLQRTI